MKNTHNLELSTTIKSESAHPTGLHIMSRDVNNNEFMFRFKDGKGEELKLSDKFTVEVLSVFTTSNTQSLTTARILGDFAFWSFDTSLITREDTVFNYVYIKKDGVPIVSADANAFYFNVGLSKIDENAGRIAESYDKNYEKVLHEFEVAINLTKDEWIEMSQDAKAFVDEIKDKTVDEFVELKMGEELQNLESNYAVKLTELQTNDTALTAQLAQKASGTFYRSGGSEIQPNVVSGSIYNKVEDGYAGNVIAGGGTAETHANVIGGNVDAIGNPNMSNYATEEQKQVDTNSNLSTISGGYDNVVLGLANNVSGHHNGVRNPTNHSSIAGGVFNLLEWGMGQSIAGGQRNKIRSTSKASQGITDSSTIGGGVGNLVDDSLQSTIAGGGSNIIETGAINTIGGGGSNKIKGSTTAKNANTIGGGTGNNINEGTANTIGGGQNNQSPAGSYSTIPGGRDNITTSDYTTAIGSKAKAYAANQIATGFNVSFKEIGDAQVSENIKVKTTIDETQTYVNTFLRAGSMAAISIKVVARRTDVAGDYAVFMIKGAANVSAGSNGTLIGTPAIEKFATAGAANWSATLAMSAAQVLTYVKGEDGKTIQWVVHYEFVENLG